MSRKHGLNPIENIDQANLNPGGNEIHTHDENETKVIHNIDQVVIPPIEISVTTKLVNIIRGYYNSPNGVYPITEFFYYVSEESLEIYDRYGAKLITVGIGSFTSEEVEWILANLQLYLKGGEDQDTSRIHLDFITLRNEGWMVFRRSGTFNTLIGYIRRFLSHVHREPWEADYYFEDREDTVIVSPYEKAIINSFIQNTIPIIDVTNITVDYEYVKLLKGRSQILSIGVYPLNADDRTYTYYVDDDTIASFNIDTGILTAVNQGTTSVKFSSKSNPDVSALTMVEVIEYDKLYNDTYKIVRGNSEGYDMEEDYIIGMDEGITVQDLLDSFKNNSSNLRIYGLDSDEPLSYEDSWQWVKTGMIIKLYQNGDLYDTLRIIIRGDIDGTGTVNEFDKQAIRNHVNGAEILTGFRFVAADVDKNRTVNLEDLNMIDKYIKGEIRSLN